MRGETGSQFIESLKIHTGPKNLAAKKWRMKEEGKTPGRKDEEEIAVFSPKTFLLFNLWLSKETERSAWLARTFEARHSLVRLSRLSLWMRSLYRLRGETSAHNTAHRR